MSKRIIFLVVVVLCISIVSSGACYAFVILSKEDALKAVLGAGSEVVVESKDLTGEKLAKVKERLGGELVHHEAQSESAKVEARTTIDFYFGKKNGQKSGVAIIDEEPGKWGPVVFIIGLDLEARVRTVSVMSYQEKRGRPIARRSFLKQYQGKSSKSFLIVGKDITGISGATVSSKAATFAVKKAIVLYEELYLRQKAQMTK